jgi:hypothetical protein
LADKLVYSIIPFILLTIFNVLILRNITKCGESSNIILFVSHHRSANSNETVLLERTLPESVPLDSMDASLRNKVHQKNNQRFVIHFK